MAEAPAAARPTIVALVPMKHTSIRVRGKNYRTFQGQPLCYWVLKTLRACQRIDQIVVDTDSDQIRQMLTTDFPNAPTSPSKADSVRAPPPPARSPATAPPGLLTRCYPAAAAACAAHLVGPLSRRRSPGTR